MTGSRFNRVLHATLLALASLVLVMGGVIVVASVFLPVCHLSDQRRAYTSYSISSIAEALNEFAWSQGYYPEPTHGLDALVRQGLLEKVPLDAWGHRYEYSVTEETFTIKSYGEDGRQGGADGAADIARSFRKFRPLASKPAGEDREGS